MEYVAKQGTTALGIIGTALGGLAVAGGSLLAANGCFKLCVKLFRRCVVRNDQLNIAHALRQVGGRFFFYFYIHRYAAKDVIGETLKKSAILQSVLKSGSRSLRSQLPYERPTTFSFAAISYWDSPFSFLSFLRFSANTGNHPSYIVPQSV